MTLKQKVLFTTVNLLNSDNHVIVYFCAAHVYQQLKSHINIFCRAFVDIQFILGHRDCQRADYVLRIYDKVHDPSSNVTILADRIDNIFAVILH